MSVASDRLVDRYGTEKRVVSLSRQAMRLDLETRLVEWGNDANPYRQAGTRRQCRCRGKKTPGLTSTSDESTTAALAAAGR